MAEKQSKNSKKASGKRAKTAEKIVASVMRQLTWTHIIQILIYAEEGQ
jgi:hypothetical protein